jgi:pyoverdine/dityrosine biosynthesis protein Dit1
MSMERISNVLGQIKSKADISQFRFADVYTIVEAQKKLLESLMNDNIPLQEKDAITALISDIFPQLIKNMIHIHENAKAKVWKSLKDSLENSMYKSLLNEKKPLRDVVNDLLSYDFGT